MYATDGFVGIGLVLRTHNEVL